MNADFLVGFSIWSIVNVLISIGLFIYLIYTFIILRQVQIMTSTFELPGERVMKLLAIIHMIIVAGLFVLALALL